MENGRWYHPRLVHNQSNSFIYIGDELSDLRSFPF